MGNYLDQTWIAYALDGATDLDRVRAGIDRVEAHYGALYPEPLAREACGDGTMGMALWQRPNEHLRSPLWARTGAAHVAATSPLAGWRRVVGNGAPTDAVGRVGGEVLVRPTAALAMEAPFVLAAHADAGDRMVIVNDPVGAGRLYELRWSAAWGFWEGGAVWSNRLGALHLFAGIEPRADERAWGVLAAAGWFLGELTAIEGARQLRPASIVEVTRRGEDVAIAERRGLEELGELVRPRRKRLRRSAGDAAEGAKELIRDVAEAWDAPLDVDLSGGRDSRVSAAAALAAGADVELRTQDLEFGELDVVEALLEAAPRKVPSRVEEPEADPADQLLERAANLHLAHDGMRNPQSLLRAPVPIPHPPHPRPSISGHGGELGHGFYYGSEKALARLTEGGDEAVMERLIEVAHKKREPASASAYAAYEEEVAATVTEGVQLGLSGPSLLEYFYLSQRLANRSGITTRNDRWSACSTLAFARACFDLKPEERLESKMHGLVIGELVPAWGDVPFFEAESSPLRETKQTRIWEKPGHSEEAAQIIGEDGTWHAEFDPDVIHGMWSDALEGEARNYFEPTFTRVVWRATFEQHLRVLGRASTT